MAMSKPGRKLFIGNIGQDVTDAELRNYFSTFGSINLCEIMPSKNHEPGHRGFGFLRFEEQGVADEIKLKTHKINGRILTVNDAKPKLVKFFVGGIARDRTTVESMRAFFEQFGEIEDIFCIVPRGFGFVTLVEEGDNLRELKQNDHHEIDGKRCEVKVARPKEEYQASEEWNRKKMKRGPPGGHGGYNNPYYPQHGGMPPPYGGHHHNPYYPPPPSHQSHYPWGSRMQSSDRNAYSYRPY